MNNSVGGRPTVFGGKVRDSAHRFQGWLSVDGLALFQQARDKLASIAGLAAAPSDADTIEYLLRGRKGTEEYLREKRRR
jgi:hypothetical protein